MSQLGFVASGTSYRDRKRSSWSVGERKAKVTLLGERRKVEKGMGVLLLEQ